MLGKMLKDEIKYYRIPCLVTFLIGLIITIFFKIACMLPYNQYMKEMIQMLCMSAFNYMISIIFFVVGIIAILRFYNTVIADGGYLTWTLPVKSSTVLWSKSLAALFWKFIVGLLSVVYCIIFFAGSYWVNGEISFNDVEGSGNLLRELSKIITPQILFTIFLIIILIILVQFLSQIQIYFSMAVGQMVAKWRILLSIGCYIALNIVQEIVALILIALFLTTSIFSINSNIDFNMSGSTMLNTLFFVLMVVVGIESVIFFVATNSIFKKHLNLS